MRLHLRAHWVHNKTGMKGLGLVLPLPAPQLRQPLVLAAWLLSLNLMFLRFAHAAACVKTSSPFTGEQYCTGQRGHTVFTPRTERPHCVQSQGWTFRSRPLSAIMNNTALNTCSQVCVWTYVSFLLSDTWGWNRWIIWSICV